MATLNTLRTRGALFLSIVIGVALVAFLLGDLTSASSIFYNKRNRVGSINGNNIDYMEFAAESDNLSRIIQNLYGNSSLTVEQMDQVREMVWNSYMRRYSYDPGYRKLGLMTGESEQLDMIRGQYVSPVITSMFTNPNTGIYEPSMVEGFIANMDFDTSGNSAVIWDYIKDQMVEERVYSKYNALLAGGIYVNKIEEARGVEAANEVYSGRYASVPFSQIADSLVKVSSAEVRKYYDRHKELFRQAASRDIEYVVFDLATSQEDYTEAAKYVEGLATEFAAAESPMQYASLNSQARTDENYYSRAQLSGDQAAIAFGDRKGQMAGPTLSGNIYTISRVAAERMMPDSVGARHILLPANKAASADSLIKAIKGGKSILELAPLYTADTSVDLGVFAPEMMIEPFANALIDAKKGDVFKVDTQYGTHVVEMTYKAPAVPKVQIATITYHVEPSAATEQAAYNEARDFLTIAAGSRDNFDAAVSQTGASRRVATIMTSDRNVRGLADSRELVRWSYNTSVGTVSPIMDIDGDYVVAVLTGAKEAGIADVKDVASDVAMRLVRDKKAEMLAARMVGKSIDEVAAMEGATSGEIKELSASAFYIPDLGVEPAVIGAVENVEVGSVSKPIKGMVGEYVVAVDVADHLENATPESEKVRLEAVAETSLAERAMQAMIGETKVVDNRAKFFLLPPKNPIYCVTLPLQNAHLRKETDAAERKQKPLADYAEPRGGKDREAGLNSAFARSQALSFEFLEVTLITILSIKKVGEKSPTFYLLFSCWMTLRQAMVIPGGQSGCWEIVRAVSVRASVIQSVRGESSARISIHHICTAPRVLGPINRSKHFSARSSTCVSVGVKPPKRIRSRIILA
jgi:peptidyl-prolyl cis-trans isomerase D